MSYIILLIITVAVLIIAVTGFGLMLAYKRQIQNLTRQINFVTENPTNLKISTWLTFKSINELVVSLNAMLTQHKSYEREYRKIDATLKQTITSISHDIRTPLTSATGYTQMVRNPNTSPEQKDRYLEIIESRIFSVKKMLNQLFEFARIEANELALQYEKININNVLRDTIAEFYDDFIKKGFEPEVFIPDQAFEIYGDRDALKRVFENIIGNAIFHGNSDFSLMSKQENTSYRIEFYNHTNTVKKEDIESIFDRFYTIDKLRTGQTTGLGLAIARQLVGMMGGKIFATIEDGYFGIIIEFSVMQKKEG